MSGTSLKSIIFGFVAGAIATVTVHEAINYVLLQAGIFPRVPWSMEPVPGFGFPQIVSDATWGGLWGVIFALILGDVPKGSMTLKGIILGILGPALVGVGPLGDGQRFSWTNGEMSRVHPLELGKYSNQLFVPSDTLIL